MPQYEPGEDLILSTRKRASNIIRLAEKEADAIRAENSKAVEKHIKELEIQISSEVEKEYASQYSGLKIDYDKKVQDLLFGKLIQLKADLLAKISKSPAYADFLNRFSLSKMDGREDARIYAGMDARLLSLKNVLVDEKMGHGVRIELPEKLYVFNLDDFVEKYLHENPLVTI